MQPNPDGKVAIDGAFIGGMSKHNFDYKVLPKTKTIQKKQQDRKEEAIQKKMDTLCHRSLFVFSINNPIRIGCIKTMENPWFDRVILFCIFLNSLVYVFQDYTKKEEDHW